MRNLIEYTNTNDLQRMYEDFGNYLLDDIAINEGLSNKIEKVKQIAQKLKDKISDEISTTAKNAINNIKKKAGEKWENIKEIYTSIVSYVDQTLTKFKPMLKDMSQFFKKSEDELELKLAIYYVKLFTTGHSSTSKIFDLMMKFPETTKQIILFNMLILSSGFLGDYGIDISMISDWFDALKESRGGE